MRNIIWKISVLTIAVFFLRSFALAQGLNGFFDVNKNSTKQYEDGDNTSSSETLNRNLYLNVQEPITPVLSYQFNLRTNFLDSETTDSLDETSTRYSRSLEPALDLILGNPVYSLSMGIRRREQWTAAHMNNDSRRTNEYYYSRLSLLPEALPSLTLQLDKQRNYDYLSTRAVDDSNSVYSINSAYDLPSRDVKFRYTLNYSYTENKTPLNLTNKTVSDNFNGTYSIGYSSRFWQNKADYAVGYQGNYSRNKSTQFVTQTGTILNERTPLAGIYKQGKISPPSEPNFDGFLPSKGELIDGFINKDTGIGLSAIGSDEFQNIGIQVSSANTVDRLYIYVDKDVNLDANLRDSSNWLIYKSNFNQAGTWIPVDIKSVTVSRVDIVDIVDNIFRYEIQFTSAQNASFYKAINLETSSIADVNVTEIEAYGTDLAEEDKLVDATNSFTQQLGFLTNFRPTGKLTLAFNYSIDRSDQNMVSIMNSVSGIFENIFSDSFTDEKTNFISNITRGYSASAVWLTHRFLTTTFRVQRNESFDNIEETDVDSNSYNLSFLTEPLPTLNANLSLIRSDSFSFSEKATTNDSMLLSIGSRLYRDLNMITDIVYTQSHSFVSEKDSSTRQINGTLDALLTRKLSGTITYHFSRALSDGTPSDSREGSVFLTYRPGKLINITGNFKITDSDGEISTAEGMLLDWLPLPAIRLNANYQHSDSEPGPVKIDTINGYVIWYVTKFADVRFINSYSQQVDDNKTENYSTSASLNCRF
jgi:hypothetical protein